MGFQLLGKKKTEKEEERKEEKVVKRKQVAYISTYFPYCSFIKYS